MTPEEQQKMAASADEAADLLKAMSNQHRLLILCVLLDRELSVGEINAAVPLSQSALSQHLAALRRVGLVSTRREAQSVFYRVSSDAVLQIIQVLKQTFCP